MGALALGSGPASAADASGLVDTASADVDPAARSAAADVVSAHWSQLEQPGGDPAVAASTLFGLNGVTPSGTPEGRLTGFSTQRTRILSDGDPLVGEPLTTDEADNSQLYADMALEGNAPSVTVERRFVRAVSVIFNIRQGFAIVPGGPSEAFNRVQSCIVDGAIETNQDNLVNGVSLDCSSEVVRRAVSDVIASGFYTNFGDLPSVDFGCEARLSQAESGATVAARWAAAQAYVESCAEPTVDAHIDLASNGGSTELQFAAVGPLAELLAQGDTAPGDLLSQSEGAPQMVALAHTWAAGLKMAPNVEANAAGNPVTPTTGNLRAFSAANLDNPKNAAAIAPFAQFFADQAGLDLGRLTLTISMEVDGADVPLQSSIQTLQ